FHPRDESFLTFINEDAEVRRLGFAVSGQGGRNSIAAQLRVFRRYRALLRDWYPRQLDDLWRAAGGGADVVVTSPLMSDPGVHVAERLGAHPVLAPLIPNYVPSWTYPSLQLRLGTRLPRPLNRLSHLLPTNSQPRKRDIRRWRVRTLALPPHPARWN